MTEKKEPKAEKAKAEPKAAAAKKPAAAKAEKAAAHAKAAAPAKAKAESKAATAPKSGKTITVQQIGSPIGRQGYQRGTLIGLGLNKMRRTRTLEDTPSVRGMIESIKHLIKIVE